MPRPAAFAFCFLFATAAGAQSILTGTGASGGPNVKAFNSGGTPSTSFLAFSPTFTGGVTVAYGDVNGDGVPDIITGTATGSSEVKVFDGTNPANVLYDFLAFAPSFTGGIWVAAGDVNGDGYDDIIVGANAGGGPVITVYSG